MKEDLFIDLVGKKLTDSLDEVEDQVFKDLLAESDQYRTIFEAYRSVWEKSKTDWKVNNSDEVFSNVISRIEDGPGIPTHVRKSDPSRKRANLFFNARIAASLIVFLAAIYAIYFMLIDSAEISSAPEEVPWIVKSNPKGQKSTVRLPDGSMVKLNSDSYLEYPEKFGDSIRVVKLVGEAFFEVQSEPLKPFMVLSGDNTTRVLGTSFNIKAFPYDYNYRVAVVTGKVEVMNHEKVLAVLEKDQMLIFNHRGRHFLTSDYDRMNELAWKDGIIYFNRSQTQKIKKVLERWYGVDIILKDPHALDTYTGTFTNATLKEVLEGISYASDIKYKIEGKKVYIY